MQIFLHKKRKREILADHLCSYKKNTIEVTEIIRFQIEIGNIEFSSHNALLCENHIEN